MCEILFKINSKHGLVYKFGPTPGVGCQYGTFTIKTLLYLCHNINIPTWVAFIKLIKDFDTSNHALIIDILKNVAHPPRLCLTIKVMYNNSAIKLIIGEL